MIGLYDFFLFPEKSGLKIRLYHQNSVSLQRGLWNLRYVKLIML